MQIEPGLMAGLGAIFGHLATRVLMNRQENYKLKHDEATQIRKELKERCDKLQTETDSWQQKYYSEMNQMKDHIFNLRMDNTALRIQLADLKTRGWIPDYEQERYQ